MIRYYAEPSVTRRMRANISPRPAGVAAFASALVPVAFLASSQVFSIGAWFDVVFVGAPMLLIPAVVLARRQGGSVALKGAVLAAFFGLAGFLSIIALLPFYMQGAPGSIPEGVFLGMLGMAMIAGLGVMLSSIFARTMPHFLGLLGVVAAATWMIVLSAELLDIPAAPWLGAVWLFAHAGFGLGLGFHLFYGVTLRRRPA